MKKIFTIFAIVMGLMLPMQAQNAYIYKTSGSVKQISAEQIYFNNINGETFITPTADFTLDAIAGTYSAYASSAFQGEPDEEWTVTITRDAEDANKVWIDPILLFAGLDDEYIDPVYAIFDEAAGTLTLPMGQKLANLTEQGKEFNFILGCSADGKNIDTTGSMTLLVGSYEGLPAVSFGEELVIGVGNSIGDEWWYQALLYTTYLRDLGNDVIALAEVDSISTVAPQALPSFFHNGAFAWNMGLPVSESETQDAASMTNFTLARELDLSELMGADAEGIPCNEWTVTGFMEDLDLFSDGGEAYPFSLYSFYMSNEGEPIEIALAADLNKGYCPIGVTMMQDQAGNKIAMEVNLGDLSENYLYAPEFMVLAEEGAAYFAGDQAVLWYIYEGSAYLFGYIYDLYITPADAAVGAPARAKVRLLDNAMKLGEGTPVQIANKKF